MTGSALPSSTPPRWTLLVVLALSVLVLDQVSKFLAVKHLTTVMREVRAETLPQQVEAWVTEKNLDYTGRNLATPPKTLVPAFWSWRYAENPGAAWSIGRSLPDGVRRGVFLVIPLLATLLITLYYRRLHPSQMLLRVALGLVLGGALGNFIDRVLRGYVIDFVDWHLADPTWQQPSLHWPTFNVADVGISCGVALIVLDSIVVWWQQRKAPAQTAGAQAD